MSKKVVYCILGILIIAGVIYVVFNHNKSVVFAPNINIDPNSLAGMQTGNYPWSPEINNLEKRLQEIGLPALSQEGTVLHAHQHLDIFINGQQAAVAANIGIDDAKGFISPIHTHDETGITHVESPIIKKFYLGQFFDIWGLRLTSDCIGGYCNNKDQTLKVFVNGNLFSGNPRLAELQAHQEIVITYGTIAQLPSPIPSSYAFPAGY
jgi:hypothetical protein